MLTIPENVFLLSLYEKRNGSIQFSKSPYLSYGLVAGSLSEVILRKVGMVNSSRRVVITNPITDIRFIPSDLIRHLLCEKDYKRASFWIEAIGHKRKKLEEEFLANFIEKNFIILDGHICQFLSKNGPEPTIKFLCKEEIRRQVLGPENISLSNYILIKIMSSIHMLDQIFTFDEIKPIHLWVDQLKATDLIPLPTEEIDGINCILEALNQVINTQKE